MGKVAFIKSRPDVLVICVNFHTAHATRLLIRDLLSQEETSSLRIAIVNNSQYGGDSPSLRKVAAEHPEVDLIEPGINLGYFGAADYAFTQHTRTRPLPEWVVVSNPDITLPACNFFKQLFTLYSSFAPGVIAPAVISAITGTDQNPYLRRRPSGVRMHFYKWVSRFRAPRRGYQRLSLAKLELRRRFHASRGTAGPSLKPKAIYAAHGSFILFHRSYFAAGGTLRHGAFLFGEEIFVAETARRLGLSIIYDPRLVVEHQQGTPSKILQDQELAGYARDAAAFVAQEFF